MPVSLTYPGVYVQEIPSGVHTITGVATSITAFIGRTARGPDNKPYTINSFGDFERTFGGLWAPSSLGYAVRDFFLNGGGQAIIVRLFNPDYRGRRAAGEEQDQGRRFPLRGRVERARGARVCAPRSTPTCRRTWRRATDSPRRICST